MKLFDTHCHFETTDEARIRATLERAKSAGVEALMAVGGSAALNEAACIAQSVASDSPLLPRVTRAFGFDRDQVGRPVDFAAVLSQADRPVALGEIGLDYHYAPETRVQQMKLFSDQLVLAHARDLPVVIHTREADDDTLALLREIPSRGIIHCYTGTPEAARKFLDLGFYISISGIVTFRAADNVRASARIVPDDRILIETDSPFLAPVPLRGQPNEPAFIVHTCAFLSEMRGMPTDDFASLTFANAERALGPVNPL